MQTERALRAAVPRPGTRIGRSLSAPAALWRRLNLWPRLVIAVTLGFAVLFAVFAVFALRAVDDSTSRILGHRLVIAKMAAGELDRLLGRGFTQLAQAEGFAPFDPHAESFAREAHGLRHVGIALGRLSLGVYFLDARGGLVLGRPRRALPTATFSREPFIREAIATRRRAVSAPFRTTSGQAAVALVLPVLNADGSLRALLVGVIDTTSEAFTGPLGEATRLGKTGHGEIVGPGGIVIAATEPDDLLKPGEHWEFYRRSLAARRPLVENVPYTPWHPVPKSREGERHVMAFAPLAVAPWGVTVGGTDTETFAPVHRLERTLLLSGAASLAVLWLLTLLGARLLVRPVRSLTRAAREMAGGDLDSHVRVTEGGEIGVLADSLEGMRAQLKESLETVRRWGEELEAKVEERTVELTLRNRQLAAVTAVATAANRAQALDTMVGACLDAVIEHTQVDGAAVRLLDERTGRLGEPIARGASAGFPCGGAEIERDGCPCGIVASSGSALYLGREEHASYTPACQAHSGALTVLPLRSGKGVLGVLALAGEQEAAPRDEDRRLLAAVSDQIAVALENQRLLEEVGQLHAQRELQRVKAELISAVSHELRTPLGFIKGYATTLLRDRGTVDDETERQFLEIIDEETGKLEKMIDDLLDVSRLQAGRLSIERETVELAGLVRDAVAKMQPQLEDTGHEVLVRIPGDGMHVLGDPLRLEQVLNNLLENASRYGSPDTPVEVAVVPDDGHVVVTVTSRGLGISADEQERVFEPFYRGESSRGRGLRGSGLGLAICRGLLEAQNGRIWVESVPGEVTTFLFSLPLAPAPPGHVRT